MSLRVVEIDKRILCVHVREEEGSPDLTPVRVGVGAAKQLLVIVLVLQVGQGVVKG
jgi:hypothetical protein